MKTALLAAALAATIYVSVIVAMTWLRGDKPKDFNDK